MNNTPDKTLAGDIIRDLRNRIVPKDGFQYFSVGRQEEVIADLEGLDYVRRGGHAVKLIIGDYGSGKTLEKHRCKSFASKKGFVTSSVDFGPRIRLYANDGSSLALWKHMVKNLDPSLEIIMDAFVDKCQADGADIIEVAKKALKSISGVDSNYFNCMVLKYVGAKLEEDEFTKNCVLDWLSGAYRRRDVARKNLGLDVEEIITDETWYRYLKCFSQFVVLAGFSGLAIYLDEAINLYKIDSSSLRDKNYESLLGIINDEESHYLYVMILGTIDFLKNRKRGLYSYGALATRLTVNPHATKETPDYLQPVVELMPLDNINIFLLLKNVKSIYDIAYENDLPVTDDDLKALMEEFINKPGGANYLTPRELIKGLIFILDLLLKYPDKHFSDFCKQAVKASSSQSGPNPITTTDNIEEL